MVIYTKTSSPADDPFVLISMGDGTTVRVERQSVTPVKPDVDREVFQWEYTYANAGTYIVTWVGENRNGGILNMAAPTDQLSFSISTTISINPLRGLNSTPVLTVAPIDEATAGERWVHNPGAIDADGDSLSFKLIQPQYRNPSGVITNVPGYRDPHTVDNCRNATNTGASTFTLDPVTGQLTWDAPCRLGEYNVAFVVEEWRVTAAGAVLISKVVRDMQILVVDARNRPPVLVPRDTCIVAGTTLTTTITATDPDNHPITLTVPGTGGILPPATFTITQNQPGRAAGRLVWNTTCENVQARPYQLIFRAEDNPPPPSRQLADLQPYRITVVGPPPQNLMANAEDRNVRLTWDRYTCQNASTIRIYRREGPSGFVPGPCETGVPASTGYVLIAEVSKDQTEYFDDNNGQGLAAGAEYCYIIYAEFPLPAGGKSIASMEACVVLERDIPYITNVTVDRTDVTNGQITVRWTQPGPGIERLNPPFEYRLFRKVGQEPGGTYQQVFTSRRLSDTVFVNSGLNTEANAYRYKLEFYSTRTPGGTAPNMLRDSTSASSVRLTAVPTSTQNNLSVALNWTYNVPWRNEVLQHQVYRVEGANLVEIGSVSATATSGTFTDRGSASAPLERGKTYCYVVRTQGSYQIDGLPEPLQNFSQQVCVNIPRIVCPPQLSIDALNCEAFFANPTQPPYQNVLTWVPQITGDCTDEIDFYSVYFRGPGQEEYQRIATTKETTYTHTGLESFAGCYYVTATSLSGEESEPSNEVCKDNCIFFLLPNIITPNGDGKNDVFRPDRRAAFIRSTNFKVFNRWGVKVYESSQDPYINWPGTDNDGKRLTDGVYYYEAEVEFITVDPAQERNTYKGWVEIVR
ncbi:gliding motility-associated C-terminal domain-containing protein [Pontibacter sp. JH31]|uniref:Gliding motility-associated C-terminal domain-containing protein n=2 Tax=Pontibacter aquaedesilientis TaxID=2766980 RepID=A0ABR7XK93_9BACT|nr:gliding motility-associated C-terminal domain-containing protein [Pontibacter aquaedesilientis]